MKIIPVSDKKSRTMFLDMVKLIYKDDDAYIRPLDQAIEGVFNPETNVFFNHGEAARFLLIDEESKVIGRIAVFINTDKAFGFAQPTGGIGFFECINNKEAAFRLFDTARDWLRERGMEAMDGPINFGENDSYWGLLVEGFTPPAFGMQYNPPYYRALFESYGFVNYFEQITHHLQIEKSLDERFWNIAKRVISREDYSFKHYRRKESEKFITDFVEIYNEAWRFHENFTPMNPDTLRKTLQQADSFLDEELIWYAYYKNEPIGFLVIFPDVNQIIKYFNGKLNLWNKIRFAYYKSRKKMNRARGVIIGVKTKFQRLGIESGFFWHLREAVAQKPYLKEIELSWVGDFNPKMRSLQEAMGADFGKRHITYRYVFDASMPKDQKAGTIPLDNRNFNKT